MTPGHFLILGIGIGCALTLVIIGLLGLRQGLRISRGYYVPADPAMTHRPEISPVRNGMARRPTGLF